MDLQAPGVQNATLKSCRHLGNQKHSGALGSERQHQQAVQDSGRNITEKGRRERGNRRTTREIGYGVPVIQAHASRAFREMHRSARGGDLWARRARRCAAAVKGEVMVEVSDGQGQVARACEDRGFKTKTWVIEGLSSAQALPLALRHLSQNGRLLAVIIKFQSRIPHEFVGSRGFLCLLVVNLTDS